MTLFFFFATVVLYTLQLYAESVAIHDLNNRRTHRDKLQSIYKSEEREEKKNDVKIIFWSGKVRTKKIISIYLYESVQVLHWMRVIVNGFPSRDTRIEATKTESKKEE